MPNWDADEGADSCGCTYSKACPHHADQQKRRNAEFREDCASRGINPDCSVEGLEEIIMQVTCSPALSSDQKDAIMRILLPRVWR